jgi:hypothetical protein
MDIKAFPNALRQFTFNGTPTLEKDEAGIRYFVNEYWTSGQRRGQRPRSRKESVHFVYVMYNDVRESGVGRYGGWNSLA